MSSELDNFLLGLTITSGHVERGLWSLINHPSQRDLIKEALLRAKGEIRPKGGSNQVRTLDTKHVDYRYAATLL